MAINTYTQGELVRISASFANGASPIDPGSVFVNMRYPTGGSTLLSGSLITSPSSGVYYSDIDASVPGKWHYRWYSTGCGQAAKANYFKVLDPEV